MTPRDLQLGIDNWGLADGDSSPLTVFNLQSAIVNLQFADTGPRPPVSLACALPATAPELSPGGGIA